MQWLMLAFFASAWVSLVVIFAVAPDVYDRALRVSGPGRTAVEQVFLTALSLFLVVAAMGVVRRWRWTFWLLLLAFLAGPLRVAASVLQLTGLASSEDPGWYVALQGAIGVAQFAIGVGMLVGYRRSGVIWTAPWRRSSPAADGALRAGGATGAAFTLERR